MEELRYIEKLKQEYQTDMKLQEESLKLAQMLQEEEKQSAVKKETCIICYSTFQYEDMTALNCDHRLCYWCVRRMIKAQLDLGKIDANDITCPHQGCGHPLEKVSWSENPEVSILEAHMEQSDFQRLLKWRVEKQKGLITCPKCNIPVFVDENRRSIPCPTCLFSFCSSCMEQSH